MRARPAFSSLLLVLGALASQPSRAATPSRAPAGPTVTCAFSNPAYSGWCRVTEQVPATSTPVAVCQSVLACLNNTACARTYCKATEIRQGWKLEEVRAAEKEK